MFQPPVRAQPKIRRRKMERLRDGTTGYSMFPDRMDDCLRAAVATVLQVEPRAIPDPQIARRLLAGDDPDVITRETWALLERWLSEQGLRLLVHDTPPIGADRWIGVCAGATAADTAAVVDEHLFDTAKTTRTARRKMHRDGTADAVRGVEHFSGHCLVMAGRTLLFDPAAAVEPPTGMVTRRWRPSDVTWGISFERIGGA